MRRAIPYWKYLAAAGPLLAICAGPSLAQTLVPPAFSAEEVAAAQLDRSSFTIDPASIKIEEIGSAQLPPTSADAPAPLPGAPTPGTPGVGAPTENPEVDWGSIINLGKTIWQIIEANKPVVDVKSEFASALPKGVKSADELAGWKPPVGTVYELSAKNLYGAQVVKLRYQVLRTTGGNYFGRGKYVAAATVQPIDIDVLWGYRFSLDAKIPSVTNAGSRQEPNAGMLITVAWKMQTPLKENDGASSYYLQGDGLFQTVQQTAPSPAAQELKPFDPSRFGLASNPEDIRW